MMKRWRTGLAVGLLAFLGVVQAQEATIYYKVPNAKDSASVNGVIEEENLKGVKIRPRGTKDTKWIPGNVIERVTYKSNDVAKLTFETPFAREQKARGLLAEAKGGVFPRAKDRADAEKNLQDAVDGYTRLVKEVKEAPVKRYLQFKAAEATALQARLDPARAEAAVKALTDFKDQTKEGWELPLALERLARLQEEANKLDDARKTYEELAELPGAPEELKQQSAVLVGKLYLRGGQYREAGERLAKVAEAMSDTNPQKPLAQAYLIESQIGQDKLETAQKDLTALIRGSSDPRLRGVAYALLGDYYLKKGDPAEAFWNYLRVDAQYNEDAEAHARALYRLSELFDRVKKDPVRAGECLQRLIDGPFEGSPYQKEARAKVKTARE